MAHGPFVGSGGVTVQQVADVFNAGANNNSAFTATLTGTFINGANETAVTATDPKTLDAAFDTTTYVGRGAGCQRHVVRGLDLQLRDREFRHDQHGLHLASAALISGMSQRAADRDLNGRDPPPFGSSRKTRGTHMSKPLIWETLLLATALSAGPALAQIAAG